MRAGAGDRGPGSPSLPASLSHGGNCNKEPGDSEKAAAHALGAGLSRTRIGSYDSDRLGSIRIDSD